MEEIERLIHVSRNLNPTEWEKEGEESRLKICFLNCRSIQNRFYNIKADTSLLKSDIIILTETWLPANTVVDEYSLKDYITSLNNSGRGKGIATYYKYKGGSASHISMDGFSISKIEYENLVVIGVYRSTDGNVKNLLNVLQDLVDTEKTTVIGGDMNICILKQRKNLLTQTLENMDFNQLVAQATHVDGGALDHIYVREGQKSRHSLTIEYFAKYYSDHDGICLTIREAC